MLYAEIWLFGAVAWMVFFSIFERPQFNWGVIPAMQIFALILFVWPYLLLGYVCTHIALAVHNRKVRDRNRSDYEAMVKDLTRREKE